MKPGDKIPSKPRVNRTCAIRALHAVPEMVRLLTELGVPIERQRKWNLVLKGCFLMINGMWKKTHFSDTDCDVFEKRGEVVYRAFISCGAVTDIHSVPFYLHVLCYVMPFFLRCGKWLLHLSHPIHLTFVVVLQRIQRIEDSAHSVGGAPPQERQAVCGALQQGVHAKGVEGVPQ